MPASQQSGFDPERFAALVATFDNNPNEAEGMNGARLFRRMAHGAGLRVVDLFYRADIMAALDGNLQPVREASPELAEARTLIEKLREDNAQLEKDGAALALALKRQEAAGPSSSSAPCPARVSSSPAREYAGGFLAFNVVMAVAALLFAFASRIAAAVFGG
jgi:hypothetical protein